MVTLLLPQKMFIRVFLGWLRGGPAQRPIRARYSPEMSRTARLQKPTSKMCV